jgi:hypothetical protein
MRRDRSSAPTRRTFAPRGRRSPRTPRFSPPVNYWEEHGRDADSAAQIASSIRQFIGFLMQDEATTDVTVAQLNNLLFERFRKWRMKPHTYDVPWGGKDYRHSSAGVSARAFSATWTTFAPD